MERVEELIAKLMEYSAASMELFQKEEITLEEMERRVASVHLQLIEFNKAGAGV